jgi:hypothetical protein
VHNIVHCSVKKNIVHCGTCSFCEPDGNHNVDAPVTAVANEDHKGVDEAQRVNNKSSNSSFHNGREQRLKKTLQ